MTNDEMIELAKKAGVLLPTYQGHIEHMMRFAELVAAKERELCAKMAEAFHVHGYDFTGNLELHEVIRAGGLE